MSGTQTLTLADFLLARFNDDQALLEHAVDVAEWYDHRMIDGQAHVRNLIEAKRRIAKAHHAEVDVEDDGTEFWSDCRDCWQTYPCATIRALALPYATHPDYRPEWRP